MPLVKTPMIAPTKIYDSFPTITPEEAADLVCEAIRAKPKQINTRLGTFGEVAYALAPKAVDQILHMAYKVFPDSAAGQGQEGPRREGVERADRAGPPDEGRALVPPPPGRARGGGGGGGIRPRGGGGGGGGGERGGEGRAPAGGGGRGWCFSPPTAHAGGRSRGAGTAGAACRCAWSRPPPRSTRSSWWRRARPTSGWRTRATWRGSSAPGVASRRSSRSSSARSAG